MTSLLHVSDIVVQGVFSCLLQKLCCGIHINRLVLMRRICHIVGVFYVPLVDVMFTHYHIVAVNRYSTCRNVSYGTVSLVITSKIR